MKFLAALLLLATQTAFASWTVTAYNIRNFDHDADAGPTNIAELQRILKDVKSDVMGFEEVVNGPAFDAVIKKTFPTYAIIKSSCGGFGKQSLALIYDQAKFDFVKKEEDLSFSGKENACGSLRPVMLVTLKQKTTNQMMIFASIHLKAGGDSRAMSTRWAQYKKLRLLAGQYEKANIFMMGDFNTTGYNLKNEDYKQFDDFLGAAGLRTVSENIACTNYWHGADQDPSFMPSVLDHIVMQDKQFSQVQEVRVGGHCQVTSCRPAMEDELGVSFAAVSDHCPVQVTFK